MKIIALLPVKNEAWVLPTYLSSVSRIAEEIIALDDSSIDSSVQILKEGGATVIRYDSNHERVVNMSARRQKLLDAGREAGGTHFIWLDADETFSEDFVAVARDKMTSLKAGEKMSLRWVNTWGNADRFINDKTSPFGYIWKDFIYCDDGKTNFEDKFLSESRTPGASTTPIAVEDTNGVVIHWQFARWITTQYKQAYYRCLELVEGSRNARRINNTYSITLNKERYSTTTLPEKWISSKERPVITENTVFFLEQITKLFDTYGVEYFEALEIWHLPPLKELFTKKTDRVPVSKTLPKWLIRINKIRHEYF